MADVKYDFAADVTAAERALARLEQKVERLEGKLKQSHRTSQSGAQRAARDLKNWATGLVSVTAGFAAVQQAIGAVTQANRQLSQEVNQTIQRLAEEELKLQIQAALTPLEVADQIPMIGEQLMKTPAMDLFQGIAAQTQLVSSGFSQIDIESGAALQTLLQLQAATNQFGRAFDNPKEAIRSVSQLLKGLGFAEPSAAQVRDVGGQFTQLFAGSDVQFPDLQDLAKVAATLKTLGQDVETQMATFSTLVDVLGGAEAATALKQFATMQRAAVTDPRGIKAMESLGIQPEDADFLGETMIDVLERYRAARAQNDETTFSKAVIDIFGKRAGANVLTAIELAPTARKRLGILQGNQFDKSVEFFQQSPFADNMRTRLLTQLLEREIGQEQTWKEIGDEIKLLHAAPAASDAGGLQRFRDMDLLTDARFSAFVGSSLGLTPRETPFVKELLDEVRSQTHILQQLRDKQADQRQRSTRSTINREAHTEAGIDGRFTSTRSN